MSYTPPTLPSVRTESRVRSRTPWTVRRKSRPRPPAPQPVGVAGRHLTRRYEVEWLDGEDVLDFTRVAPALPIYEAAFGAFTHGVLIHTTDGPVAVEDLLPGARLECPSGDTVRLMWKGAITLVPGAPTNAAEPDRLYRVTAEAFGPGRPGQDQTFGPYARRVDRDPKVRAALGAETALLPIRAQVDGMSVIEVTPVAPTRVYHLATDRHAAILAGGLEVETYHPGPEAPLSMSEEMMDQFLAFFPYLASVRDFGRLAAPRITSSDLRALA